MAINNLNNLLANKELYPPIQRPNEEKYYLSADEYNIILTTLKQLIDDYNQRIDDIDGEGIKSIITSFDNVTPPLDTNLFTALKTKNEILAVVNEFSNKYLSKLNDDTANGIITFNKGVKFGNNGIGGEITGIGRGRLRSLELSEWLEVPELRYNRVEVQLGDKWRAPGGGVIEIVDTVSKTATLKLEDGEYGAISEGDLCLGIIHSLDSSENATADLDDSKGMRNIRGFASSYFKIEEVLDERNQTFRYSLRPISGNHSKQVSPKQFMHFVAFGNTINPDRQSSVYETRTYQRFLIDINNWEYGVGNIASQFGDLSNLSVHGLNMSGYSIYLNNVYFSGTIQQIKAPIIIDGYWHTWNGSEWINTGTAATMPGRGSIELFLTNNAIVLKNSNPIDYNPTITHIHVYEGEIELSYDPDNYEDPGKYRILVTGDNITPGVISLDNIHGTLSAASNITNDVAKITITVEGTRVLGELFNKSEIQNIALVSDGSDGASTEFIFKQTTFSTPPNPDPSVLDAVQEDDFVPSSSTGYPTFIGWSDDAKGIDSTNKFEWRSQRSKDNGVWGKFGEAKLISRWGMDGLDGDAYEYIFKRTPTLESPSPSPRTIPAVQTRDFVPSAFTGYPTFVDWTDDFVGTDKNLKYSWICKRERIDGVWGIFTNPEVWSTYSADGNSVETVYQNTNSMDPPPIDEEAIQIDNYIPEDWTKYPESISVNSRFQWESKREKINEVWTSFSTPSLHSVFGKDGTDIEFIFNLTEDETPPSIVYISPDFNNRTPQDAEYLPGDGTSSGWQDDHIWVTKEKPYLWVTKRRKIDDVWEEFKSPKILSVRGKDGGDYEAVYKLTELKTPPPQLISSHGDFQKPEYLPKDENGNYWLDERASISEELPYLWISERRKKDGVWQPFSPPAIDANWAKQGDPGNDGAALEYWGQYDNKKEYYGYSYKIIAVKVGTGPSATYYKTKRDVGTIPANTSNPLEIPQNPLPTGSKWENFGGNFESVATSLLLAEGANIANFIFHNEQLWSQETDSSGEPLIKLDGRTGEGQLAGTKIKWNENGDIQIQGEITAENGGNIGGFIVKDGMLESVIKNGNNPLIQLDGTNGAGHLAAGNLSWDASGNLTMLGTFESNDSGNKVIINPQGRELVLQSEWGHLVGRFKFFDSGVPSAQLLLNQIDSSGTTLEYNVVSSAGMYAQCNNTNVKASFLSSGVLELSRVNGPVFYVGLGASTLGVKMKGLIQLSSAAVAASTLSSGELWRNSDNQVFYNP